jgi:cobalt-zinc-cadmium efflux system outer membrane protein
MDCPVSRGVQTFLFGVVLSALVLFGGLSAETTQAQPRGLPDTLTFERATALLLDQNPQLRAARARVQAKSQAAQADALFPNPTLGVSEEHTPLPGDGTDDEWFLSLTQPLNYPGEQQAQQRSADAAQQAAEARLQETRTSLYNELRHRYLAVVAADARHRLLSRYTEAIRQAARAATVRYEEGDLSPIRRSRLKSAEAAFENDLAEAERQRRTARTELASMLHDGPAADSGLQVGRSAVSDSLPFRAVTVEAQAALTVATEQRARLRARRAQVERERHTLDATRYQRYPDLSLSAGPKHLSAPGGSTFGFTAGIEVQLPLWNGGRTAVEAQEGRRTQAQATLDATRRAVEVEVKSALDRLDSYRSRLQTPSDSRRQTPKTLLEDALFTYEQGELTLFELLDTIDSARQTDVRRIRLTAEYLRALYDLEAAIGIGPKDEPAVVKGALSPLRSAQLP